MSCLIVTDTIWTLVQVEDNDSFQNELSRQLVQSINLDSPMENQSNDINPFSPQQNQTSNQVSSKNNAFYNFKIRNNFFN